jgi:hypothetical protein
MPKLIYSSETLGCGATIELDSREICLVSVAQTGVLVRTYRKGRLFASFFGSILFNEKNVYKAAQTGLALTVIYPEQNPLLAFKSPMLAAYANAIWHCESAAKVAVALNEASENAASLETLAGAYAEANKEPPEPSLERTVGTYRVMFSDGTSQETRFLPGEIAGWCNRLNMDQLAGKHPYRVVGVLNERGVVVWDEAEI